MANVSEAYDEAYRNLEELADELDELADKVEGYFKQAAPVSLNLSSAFASIGQMLRTAEDAARRAL